MSDFQTSGKHKIEVAFGGILVAVEGHPNFYPTGAINASAFDRAISRDAVLAQVEPLLHAIRLSEGKGINVPFPSHFHSLS